MCAIPLGRHGGTGIGLAPSQAAVAHCSGPDLDAEDVVSIGEHRSMCLPATSR
jgi:hypothetical protein